MDIGETKDCSLPPPLTEDEISSVVDGNVSRRARAHLRRCGFCAARVAEARRIESTLAGRLHRFDCPSAQHLGDYAFGLLDEAEARAIIPHLESCARCSGELADLREFLQSDAPRTAAAADSMEVAQKTERQTRPSRLGIDEIVARLLPRAPGLAFRGTSMGREPMVAEVGDTVITLEVQPATREKVHLTGMLATLEPEAWDGAVALLWIDGEVREATTLDENGGFAFGPMPSGIATVRITPEHGATLVVPEIPLS